MKYYFKVSLPLNIVLLLVLQVSMSACAMLGGKSKESAKAPDKIYMSQDSRSSLKNAGKKTELAEAAKNAGKDSTSGNAKDINQQLNLCRLIMVRGDFAGAVKVINEILAADFRNRDAKILFANILYLQGRRDNARSLLERLGGVKAPESEVSNILALIAIKEKAIPLATQLLQSAIKKNPAELSARMNLGIIQLQLQMVDPAKKLFLEVLALKKDHADAIMHLAIISAWQGNLAGAEQLYDKAQKIGGKGPLLVFNRSVLKKRQRKFKDALVLLKEYVQTTSIQYSGREAALGLIRDIRGELVVQESKDSKQMEELSVQIEKGAKKPAGNASGDPDFVITNVGVFDAH